MRFPALLATLPLSVWGLVRVDVPDHPDAEATSRRGSTLLEPPAEGPWRVEPVPEIDAEFDLMGDPATWGDLPTLDDDLGDWASEEAVDVMRVRPWHDAGFTGQGVSIAVFDIQWFGTDLYPALDEMSDYETHDCFRHRSCELPIDHLDPRYGFEAGGHGVACAQVIHDVAPGASLHFVRVSSLTTLENAVDWAIREGVDVVSMSMSFFNNGFYDGTGEINDQMEELAAAGILMVTSAGNYATEHWSGAFVDDDGDGRHEFPGGTETLAVELGSGSRRVQLIWDDFNNCGDTDLDLYAYDSEGRLVGRSTDDQRPDSESCAPVERMDVAVAERGVFDLVVHRKYGSSNVDFDLLARNGDVVGGRAHGSVTDPGTSAAVLTVGAIRANDTYAVNGPEGFSSHGPTHAGLRKPEISGPNGLTTSVYGPGNFYGTSASTPSVAGAIAVLMSADPTLGPREAADWLVAAAVRDEALDESVHTGLGLGRARLPPPQTLGSRGCGGGAAAGLFPVLALFGLRRRREQADTVARSALAPVEEPPCASPSRPR